MSIAAEDRLESSADQVNDPDPEVPELLRYDDVGGVMGGSAVGFVES